MRLKITSPRVLTGWINENIDTKYWEVYEVELNRYLKFFNSKVNEKRMVGKGAVEEFFDNPEMNFAEFFLENGAREDVKPLGVIKPLEYLGKKYGVSWVKEDSRLIFLVNKEKKVYPRVEAIFSPLLDGLEKIGRNSLLNRFFHKDMEFNDWAAKNIEKNSQSDKLKKSDFVYDFGFELQNSDLPFLKEKFRDKEYILADFYSEHSMVFLNCPEVKDWVRKVCYEKKLEKILSENPKNLKKEIINFFAKDEERVVVKNLFKGVPENLKKVLVKKYQYLETDTIGFDEFYEELKNENLSVIIDVACLKKNVNTIVESNIRCFFKETVTEILEANGYVLEDFKCIRASKYWVEAKKKIESYPDLTQSLFVKEMIKGWNHLYALDEKFTLNADIIQRELKAFYLREQMSSDIQDSLGVSSSTRKVSKF